MVVLLRRYRLIWPSFMLYVMIVAFSGQPLYASATGIPAPSDRGVQTPNPDNGTVDPAVQTPPEAPDLSAEAEALFVAGTELARQGQLSEAAAQLEQALAKDPSHVRAMNNLGLVLHRLNRPQEALAMYRRAIETKRSFALTYKNMGILLDQLNDTAGAIEAYENYLWIGTDLDPVDSEAVGNRLQWLSSAAGRSSSGPGNQKN